MAGERVRIGITSDEIVNKYTDRHNQGHTPDYSKSIWAGGAVPYMLDITVVPEQIEEYYDDVDAFLLSGGLDINPRLYSGQEGLESANNGGIENDIMSQRLIEMSLRDGKPLMVICRGMQLLNVVTGGTLHQHLPDLVGERHKAEHEVTVIPGSFLSNAVGGAERIAVNSRHHQSIKELGRGLVVAATADDGIIEAVESADPSRFVVGVQWHEEELGTTRLFSPFIEAVRQVKYGRHLRPAA